MQRKKSAILDAAIRLFVEQGYHATSIQDILNRCNISKGTFYKYFESKGELLQESLLYIEENMNEERDRILIGEDVTSKEIFIQQCSAMMTNRVRSNFNALIEDALMSNDTDLLTFIRQLRMQLNAWIFKRFKQIFPDIYQEYLIDATLIFSGVTQYMIATSTLLTKGVSIHNICSYCLSRTEELLESVEQKKAKLFETVEFEQLFHKLDQNNFSYNELALSTGKMRKLIEKEMKEDRERQQMALELIMFIQNEVVAEKPKMSLITSTLTTLTCMHEIKETQEFNVYLDTLDELGYNPISYQK